MLKATSERSASKRADKRKNSGKTSPPEKFTRRSSDKPLTEAAVRKIYDRPRSFCDHLPWMEYLADPESRCFLMNDGVSVGAMLDITPVGTEGRPESHLIHVRDGIEAALQDSFEEYDDKDGPWVVQMFCYDQTNLDYYIENLRNYVWPRARGTQFTDEFLEIMSKHLRGASKPGGLFIDPLTDFPWQAKLRRTHIAIYRRWPRNYKHPLEQTPEAELNDAMARFTSALSNAGVSTRRMTGKDFYRWMLQWFNPKPQMTEGDARKFFDLATYPGEEDLPYGHDFAESLLYCWPRSDVATQTWWFDGMPHRCVTTQRLRNVPKPGHITGERKLGEKIFAMMDKLPESTVMSLSLIIYPQDVLENHLSTLDKKAVGETAESEQTRRDVVAAKGLIASGHKLYKAAVMFYVRGDDMKQLKKRTNDLSSLLLSQQIQPVREQDEQCGLDAYLLGLPMCYDPLMDKNTQFARFMYAQHVASLSPLFGRSEGTGNPGISFFNRGGAPLCFDPLNFNDRKKNGHLLLLGPTGAGKSATLVSLICQMLAIVRPRIFVVEAGNSFGLLADYCAKKGLTVNKVALKPGTNVSIPPFADAHFLLKKKVVVEIDDDAEPLDAHDQEGDDQRDLLGELEIIAMLMITGGEEKEADKLDRADRRMIRDSILRAAENTFAQNRQTKTEDVADALLARSKDESLPQERRNRANYMSDCMRLFCDGFEGELFNREGELWPEADVTLIDLATYAREGYSGQLAVAYTSIMNRINNLAEKYQHDDRPTIMITDEGHIITTNPLLSPFVVKVVKMWRKLGAWYWVATQNLEDFPNTAKKMLNMIEWWLLLVMPKEEVREVARFRDLTPEQEAMLLAARKEPGLYTEGVVLSAKLELLFRVVQPSVFLALAMTEKDEKVARKKLMDQLSILEVEAAEEIARQLDVKRGIALA